jgi:hypothetical protein
MAYATIRKPIASTLPRVLAVMTAAWVATGLAAEPGADPASSPSGIVRTATMVVAAADAPAQLRHAADVVCSGVDDQVVINAAIDRLPETGGRVHLTAGTYRIGAVPGSYGGVTIGRSNVVLTGEGTGTRLVLQDDLTDINTIWIRGDVHDVTVRDLAIDGNGGRQVPWVRERSQWNGGSGIKIIDPAGTPGATGIVDVTPRRVRVANCRIENCQLMAVMAHGTAVEVIDCHFTGNFGSHVVEILGHSGRIQGCTLLVKDGDTVRYGFATDRCCHYHIVDNLISVEPGGTITSHPINNWPPLQAGRTLDASRQFHGVMSGNILVNHGSTGHVRLDGYMDVVRGNIFRGVPVVIGCPDGGLGVTFAHNLLIDSALDIASPHRSPESRILVDGNQFFNSPVRHADGVVVWGTNPGHQTANVGTAVIAADRRAIEVEHGLAAVPDSVQVTPANDMGGANKFWVEGATRRHFVIRVDAAPGPNTAIFTWRASGTGSGSPGSKP